MPPVVTGEQPFYVGNKVFILSMPPSRVVVSELAWSVTFLTFEDDMDNQ